MSENSYTDVLVNRINMARLYWKKHFILDLVHKKKKKPRGIIAVWKLKMCIY